MARSLGVAAGVTVCKLDANLTVCGRNVLDGAERHLAVGRTRGRLGAPASTGNCSARGPQDCPNARPAKDTTTEARIHVASAADSSTLLSSAVSRDGRSELHTYFL